MNDREEVNEDLKDLLDRAKGNYEVGSAAARVGRKGCVARAEVTGALSDISSRILFRCAPTQETCVEPRALLRVRAERTGLAQHDSRALSLSI